MSERQTDRKQKGWTSNSFIHSRARMDGMTGQDRTGVLLCCVRSLVAGLAGWLRLL